MRVVAVVLAQEFAPQRGLHALDTEAASIAVVYAFVVAVFFYKDLRLREVGKVLIAPANMSAMLLYIITNAALFSFLMSYQHVPEQMAGWMLSQGLGQISFLLLANLLLAAGNFMEPSSIILILALPKGVTMATAPEPLDARVQLREVPPSQLAVIRYSGF